MLPFFKNSLAPYTFGTLYKIENQSQKFLEFRSESYNGRDINNKMQMNKKMPYIIVSILVIISVSAIYMSSYKTEYQTTTKIDLYKSEKKPNPENNSELKINTESGSVIINSWTWEVSWTWNDEAEKTLEEIDNLIDGIANEK